MPSLLMLQHQHSFTVMCQRHALHLEILYQTSHRRATQKVHAHVSAHGPSPQLGHRSCPSLHDTSALAQQAVNTSSDPDFSHLALTPATEATQQPHAAPTALLLIPKQLSLI